MPKHKVTKYLPLYLGKGGEILALLTTGRYVPLTECDVDGLKAFGKPVLLEEPKPKKTRRKKIMGVPDETDLITPDEDANAEADEPE